MHRDIFISDFTEKEFQEAFKLYFAELGISVKDWDGLFLEMNKDKNGDNYAYVRLDEANHIIGFIQLTVNDMKSWFFSVQVGFIREFWIREACRSKGHGGELLAMAEEYFKTQGAAYSLLTTDTAEKFYLSHGYSSAPQIAALNKDKVYIKAI